MLVFVSKLIILSYMMASTAAARRIHTSSDGTVREYINKQWIVISTTHATNNEILFLPSREFNVNFDDGEFLINDLPVLVTAKGKSRKVYYCCDLSIYSQKSSCQGARDLLMLSFCPGLSVYNR